MMDKLPGKFSPRQMATKVFKKEGGEEILVHQAEMESEIIETSNQFIDQTQVGEPIESHNVEERASQLTRGIIALVDSDIAGFYAGEYGRFRCECDPDQVTPYAAMDSDDWEERKELWYSKYVENDMATEEDTPEDVADIHLRANFGVTLEEFEKEIIDWADGRDADIIRRLFSGDPYESDYRIFTGHKTANEALNKCLNEI